jgi:general secretion pathway protein G
MVNHEYKTKKRSFSKKSRVQGFTLLEVMVVVVIIAVMAAVVAPGVLDKLSDAKIERVKADVKSLESTLSLYKLDNFQFPSTDQGLDALVTKPSGSPEPKGWKSYLKKTPMDPWKNPYKYLNPGSHGEIDVYSWGPDGRQSDDDIGNWSLDN